MGIEAVMATVTGYSPRAAVVPENVAADNYFLERFTLYETRARFYVVGRDKSKTHFRVLKIDRSETSELNISEDPVVYTQLECDNLLQRVAQGNLATGGLTKVTKAYGIVGFIRFMESYYMILITKHCQIGMLCGHAIYAIEDHMLVTIPHSSVQTDVASSKTEIRYKKLLLGVDLTKDFFFSYTYRIMQSLQRNVLVPEGAPQSYENMFVWNAYLTRSIRERLKSNLWTVAIVHGFFEQSKLSLFGRIFVITLIARRSRHFAGTRYLKRGVNDKGKVANDVETEQIVLDEESGFGATVGQMSSIVQNRGSIPLFWSQEPSKLSNPKPDIVLQRYDPTYQATKLHFEDLAQRYGNPVIVLNLIKTVEKRPREMMLRREFASAVGYLNHILPEDSRLKFIHWDFHKFAKSKSANVLAVLGAVAGEALDLTGIYYSGKPSIAKRKGRLQRSSTTSMESIMGRMSPPPFRELSRGFSGSFRELSGDFSGNFRELSREFSMNMRELSRDFSGSMTIKGISSIIIRDLERERAKGRPLIQGRKPQFQRGVLRTNCIDCLDRTNVAQYAYGLAALGRQLYALGYTDVVKLDPDSGVASALMDMYQNMGDALALQYGGSAAHKSVFPERQGKWKATTQSRELLKSIKRYYSNTYTDGDKQDAINLFLGHFLPQEGKPALWELDSDYYLHLGAFADEFPKETDRAPQKPWMDPTVQQNLRSAILQSPAYRQDYHLPKLTSFDELFQITCGPIKNVRLYNESEVRRPGGLFITAPDAAEVQLKSPNWLFGQRKLEEPNGTSAETAQKTKDKETGDKAIRDFSDFDWLASSGPAEEDIGHREFPESIEDDLSWYGTLLLPGTIGESRANQHYVNCCKGPIEDLEDIESVRTSDLPIMDELSAQYATTFKSDDVEAVMEAAMKEFEEIGSDVASIMPGGGPSVEFSSTFAQWLFKRANEFGEGSQVLVI